VNSSWPTRWAAEVAGTALLVGLGTGTVVAAARFGGIPQAGMAAAWFVAVLLPVLLFVRISGAHLNPAVTLALAVSGRIGWSEAPGYWAAQFGGAFLGSACVLFGLGGAAHLGATTPVRGELDLAFLGEAVFTAVLVASVFVLADNGRGRHGWRLALPAFAVALSTYVIGPLSGSSLNPARSVAPAILSGTYVDLWMYLLAPPLAAIVVATTWRPRSVDVAERGPGRIDSRA
jgi:glycerol uptake facilitator-like aquaporin